MGGSGIYIENTAYSFIQRQDIYHSSNLLETINEYGQLANFLIDTSLTQSDKAGLSCLIGSNDKFYSVNTPAAYAQYGQVNTIFSAGDRSGLCVASTAGTYKCYSLYFLLTIIIRYYWYKCI
jgi:hypothetical protein